MCPPRGGKSRELWLPGVPHCATVAGETGQKGGTEAHVLSQLCSTKKKGWEHFSVRLWGQGGPDVSLPCNTLAQSYDILKNG